jgi:hypothetical protein
MKKVAPLSIVFALAFASLPAAATPIHAVFSGTVTGQLGFANDVINTFPLGTLASFDVSFDDTNLTPDVFSSWSALDLAPVSGSVRLGSQEWVLNAGGVSTTYAPTPGGGNPTLAYGLHLTGTGPVIATDDSFYGLFLRLTPNLDAFTADDFMVGFRSSSENSETYGYAKLSGTSSVTQDAVAVPEPGTMLLSSTAFALMWFRRRRRGGENMTQEIGR